ncbi:hypothetical protein D9M71_299310 [compost metagenome]
MSTHSSARGAINLALGTGIDLPTQAARVHARWLGGRHGRPPVFMLALLWGRGCANVVQTLELQLDALFADYACTPEAWSEAQAARQVLASLNMLWYRGLQSGREDLPELSAGILLIQGDNAQFLQSGNVGLLRYRDGVLHELTGHEGRSLGAQAELALTQHNLALHSGEALLLAPQPLLTVIDRQALQDACRDLREETLDTLLEPFLHAPGAAALVLPGNREAYLAPVPVSVWPAPGTLRAGDQLEHWTLLEGCAYGPPGRLFHARHADGREALLLLSATAADQAFWQREWALRRCKVASLPGVLSTRVPRRHAFQLFAMPPGEWRSLPDWIASRRPLDPFTLMALLEQLVEAVRALQRRGMQGLWLEPRQVLVSDGGRLLLLPEHAAIVPGVPRQALPEDVVPLAPELRAGLPADGRADQLALAALAYWMLCGSWPQAALADGGQDCSYAPLAELDRRLPVGWDAVLARALAPDAGQRYEALSEFIQALARPLEQADSPAPRLRRRQLVAIGVLAGVLLLGIAWQLSSG